MLSVTGCSGGCGKQAEPAIADLPVATQEPEESLESIEPTPSPTVTPTAKPIEESKESEEVAPSEEVVPSEEIASSEEVVPSEEIVSSEEVESDLGYEIISTDDTTYYALQTCNLRSGPGTDYDKIGSLTYAQEIVCNGRVESGTKIWLVLKTDNDNNEVQMVSASLVSRDKPQPQQQQSSGNNGSSGQQDNSGNQGSQQQQQPPADTDSDDVTGGALAGLGLQQTGGFGSSGDAGAPWEME